MSKLGVAFRVIINGSYVTGKEEPSDIDILVIYPEDFDFPVSVDDLERRITSAIGLEELGLDMMASCASWEDCADLIYEWYSQAPELPGGIKGVLFTTV